MRTIKFSADIFIIPNHAARLSDFSFEPYRNNLKIPVTLEPKSSDKDICLINSEDEEAIADVSLTLKQTSYRYARFGNFETVLHDVCR